MTDFSWDEEGPEIRRIGNALRAGKWFGQHGAYVLLDGQFGSTGKGLAASLLAAAFKDDAVSVTTNAGPNSGHTSYAPSGKKIVLRQVPTYSAHAWARGWVCPTHLNAGAVIDSDVLMDDLGVLAGAWRPDTRLSIHPRAAVVYEEDKLAESQLTGDIGSTGKGVGAALARKVLRRSPTAFNHPVLGLFVAPALHEGVVLVETAQGFDLSLNGPFYPHCTSRECTVMQALSDARIHPSDYRQTMMTFRTFPIRVAGNSGPVHPDQREVSWLDLGVEPEVTTVTKKIRRVFTWSRSQFMEAVRVNRPEHLFFTFLDYLKPEERTPFLGQACNDYLLVVGTLPKTIVTSAGPTPADCRLWTYPNG